MSSGDEGSGEDDHSILVNSELTKTNRKVDLDPRIDLFAGSVAGDYILRMYSSAPEGLTTVSVGIAALTVGFPFDTGQWV